MTDRAAVIEAMREVIDPELGLDVVELGMVGPIQLRNGEAEISMRLTSMSCPFWELFVEQVNSAIGELEGVDRVHVRFDWTEPWTPERMTEPARRQLQAVGLMPPAVQQRGCPPPREELLQIAMGVLGSPAPRPRP